MDEQGYIKLARRAFNNFLWKEERAYSRFEAWLDMIASARWDNRAGSQLVNGKSIELYRGELIASIRYHVKRWKWSEKKVRNFRKILTEGTMIDVRRAQGETVIKLCNYDTYNTVDFHKGTAKAQESTAEGHTGGTPGAQGGHKEEEGNKGNSVVLPARDPPIPSNMPQTLEKAKDACVQLMLPDEFISELYTQCLASGFIDQFKREINSWPHYVQNSWTKQKNTQTNGRKADSSSNRTSGTLNECSNYSQGSYNAKIVLEGIDMDDVPT